MQTDVPRRAQALILGQQRLGRAPPDFDRVGDPLVIVGQPLQHLTCACACACVLQCLCANEQVLS